MEIKMEITREAANQLNAVAQMDFNTAIAMLNGINLVLGTQYTWLNKRVVFTDEDGKFHDAYACGK